MGKGITQQRLQRVAADAALKEIKKTEDLLKTKLDKNILSCRFLGTEPKNQKLNAKARILFEWKVQGMGAVTSKLFLGPVLYDQSLASPHAIKLPFLCACLPKAIGEQKALPFMAGEGEVTCRAIVLPKALDQVTLKKGTVADKQGVYWLLARVKDDTWIALNEKSPITAKNLVEEQVATILDDAVCGNTDSLRKVYAIAHFQCELARAKLEQKPVNLDEADKFFEQNATKWSIKPKTVLVRWATAGEERVDEVALRSVVKRR
jgi:hypothetical protein